MSGKAKLIIAIDGTAGSGKSTTARLVAEEVGLMHIDTGAMYRAVAVKLLKSGVELADSDKVAEILEQTTVTQIKNGQAVRFLLDGEDVTEEIRTPEISLWVGPVSENETVRKYLVRWQRDLGKDGNVILEGRDIGTVVFPDADLKIFMDADLTARVKRRRKEMLTKGIEQPPEDVETAIRDRDKRDSERPISPLKKAEDAIVLDSTHMTIGDQVKAVVDLARKMMAKNNSD